MTRKLSISEVERLLEKRGYPINASALRFWESEGLLTPERTGGNHRLFPPEEVEKSFLLALISRMRKRFANSPLLQEEKWQNLYSSILADLKAKSLDISTLKAYQNLLYVIWERLELESPITLSQPLTFKQAGLTEGEDDILKNAIMPLGDLISEDTAEIVRSILWESKRNPILISELSHISSYAWMNARLNLQGTPPMDVAGQLARRYEKLLQDELALDNRSVIERAKIMKHEILMHSSGIEMLREMRSVFSLGINTLVDMMLKDPQSKGGLLIQLAKNLERILTIEWELNYQAWLLENTMLCTQGYIDHLQAQYEFIRVNLPQDEKMDVNLQAMASYIDEIALKLTTKQKVEVTVFVYDDNT